MNCREFSPLLQDYLDRELCEDERELVEKHVESCESCRAELDELKKLSSLFTSLEKLPAPDDFLMGVRAKLEKKQSFLQRISVLLTHRFKLGHSFGILVIIVAFMSVFIWMNLKQTYDPSQELYSKVRKEMPKEIATGEKSVDYLSDDVSEDTGPAFPKVAYKRDVGKVEEKTATSGGMSGYSVALNKKSAGFSDSDKAGQERSAKSLKSTEVIVDSNSFEGKQIAEDKLVLMDAEVNRRKNGPGKFTTKVAKEGAYESKSEVTDRVTETEKSANEESLTLIAGRAEHDEDVDTLNESLVEAKTVNAEDREDTKSIKRDAESPSVRGAGVTDLSINTEKKPDARPRVNALIKDYEKDLKEIQTIIKKEGAVVVSFPSSLKRQTLEKEKTNTLILVVDENRFGRLYKKLSEYNRELKKSEKAISFSRESGKGKTLEIIFVVEEKK